MRERANYSPVVYNGDLVNKQDFSRLPVSLQNAIARAERLKEAAEHLKEYLSSSESDDEQTREAVQEIHAKLLEKMAEEEPTLEIEEEAISRVFKDLELAGQVDMLENGAGYNQNIIASILERRQWGKVFSKLRHGDKVVTFLVPGAEFLSIKYLNDEIFGMQVTDKIIEQKRKVILEELSSAMEPGSVQPGDLILDQYYKADVFRIPVGMEIDLEQICFNVDTRMTEYILKQAEGLLSEDGIDRAKIEAFIQKLSGKSGAVKGFRVNYGLSETEGDKMENQLLALNQSMQAARMSRENAFEYGERYDKATMNSELDDIADLKKQLKGKSIVDEHGNQFQILDENGFLNRDLLRIFRKGKFKVNSDLSNDLALYVKKMNLIDHVKPFTFSEIHDVEDDIDYNYLLAEKIRAGTALKEEREVAADIMRTNEKQPEYTSNFEFNRRAIELTNCAYVSIDLVDLGLDVIREYEERISLSLSTKKDKRLDELNNQSLSAGDSVTESLRDFRRSISELCKRYRIEDEDGKILGLVGGDELTLAVDLKKISEEKLQEFIFEIKKIKNTRIVKTLVASAEKKLGENLSGREKIVSHLEAMKRAERGVQILKRVEEVVRKIGRSGSLVKELSQKISGIFTIENGRTNSHFVVEERGDEFYLISKDGHGSPRSYRYLDIKPVIDEVYDKLRKYE